MEINKKKKAGAILAALALLAITALVIVAKLPQQKKEEQMLLFYSLSCPHCQNVEQYIEANRVKESFNFEQLEVSANQENSRRLLSKAKACGMNTEAIGVPFLWTGDKCLMGDTDIIEFFKK